MKKIFAALAVLTLACAAWAGVTITKVDKVAPTEQIYMDMATSAAKAKGAKNGAVIVLNNAFRSSGVSSAQTTAEQAAIAAAGLPDLHNAVIFTVNEPTTAAYNDICAFGAEAVYFVNGRDAVIAAGVYPASAYDDAKIDSSLTQVPLNQMAYPDAEQLLK